MKISQLGSHLVHSIVACALVVSALATTPASAAILQIEFTGMNLVYNGSTIYDAGSPTGGFNDPADADPLNSVEFSIDGFLIGTLNNDISLDVIIPDVTGIPSAANTVNTQTTPGTTTGIFDLLIGTSPAAAQFLRLDLEEVTITYIDVANIVQFTFGAAVADINNQNLPSSLVIGDPVTVSFSAQIVAGTRTANAGVITGFSAAGTGEIRGTVVPEPATCLLAGFGLAAVLVGRSRK